MSSVWDRTLVYLYIGLVASVLLLLYSILQSLCQCGKCPCSVRITGESILITGCDFDETFSDYAKSLVIPKHDL
ncbi:TGB3 [Rose virus B]|uniref:Movement protein TGBp3 n=1 Tax=Rose virus B TaxID=2777710 RepID=A0A7L9QHX6_9VIRU|nr:TGB3 [Rose virus B]QOL02533.1 TGB3 [Rose virus B]